MLRPPTNKEVWEQIRARIEALRPGDNFVYFDLRKTSGVCFAEDFSIDNTPYEWLPHKVVRHNQVFAEVERDILAVMEQMDDEDFVLCGIQFETQAADNLYAERFARPMAVLPRNVIYLEGGGHLP